MRANLLPFLVTLCVFVFLISCERNEPKTGNVKAEVRNSAAQPDSTQFSVGQKDTGSLPDSIPRASPGEENFSLEGQPEALADTTISVGQVGAVRLRMPLDSLYIAYGSKNINKIDLKYEEHYCPALAIYLPTSPKDKPSIVAEIDETRKIVWRIQVRDPRFRTDKDIGPGSTFAELRKHYPVDFTGEYEIGVLSVVKSFEMAFEIDPSGIPREMERDIDPKLIPGNTRIINVFVNW
ncbi:MAG: hypothetical protein ACYC9O_14485 [Candidatus Latescibacterota bacterium]